MILYPVFVCGAVMEKFREVKIRRITHSTKLKNKRKGIELKLFQEY